MIKLEESMCCGCGACLSVCKFDAISMEVNQEGFIAPVVERAKCVSCGQCEKVCPIQNSKDDIVLEDQPDGYIVQHKKLQIRCDSTSGGGFTALAEAALLKLNAKVYGAAFTGSDLKVRHICINNVDDLYRFRNSKYVQSDIYQVYTELKEQLDRGEFVLFSGTPCQVAALKRVFGELPNLFFVEVMCREVVSPLLLKLYIESKNKTVRSLRFRDKAYGYHYSVMNVKYADGTNYKKALNYDQYLRAFFSNQFARKSCYACQYRDIKRVADITIWDAWDIKKYKGLVDDDFGATKVMVNSEKGKKLFGEAASALFHTSVDSRELLGDVSLIKEPLCCEDLSTREKFYDIAAKCGGKAAFDQLFPITPMIQIRNTLKNWLYLLIKSRKRYNCERRRND